MTSNLTRFGFQSPQEVRIALHLPPLPERRHEAPAHRYLTADDRDRRMREIAEAIPLAVGLALGGVRAEQMHVFLGCSAMTAKKILKQAGVNFPRGNPHGRV